MSARGRYNSDRLSSHTIRIQCNCIRTVCRVTPVRDNLLGRSPCDARTAAAEAEEVATRPFLRTTPSYTDIVIRSPTDGCAVGAAIRITTPARPNSCRPCTITHLFSVSPPSTPTSWPGGYTLVPSLVVYPCPRFTRRPTARPLYYYTRIHRGSLWGAQWTDGV